MTPVDHPDRLESWKEIADYLGKGVTTVRRWEREEGLPVRRQEHLKRGSVVAFRHEIDAWLHARTTPLPEEPAPLPMAPEPPPPPRGIFRPAALAVAVGMAAAVLAIAAVWRPAWDLTELGTVPLTSTPGAEGHVAFGPGGAYAYAHDGVEVLVHSAGAGAGKVIWKPEGKSPSCVSWSRNGKWLAISQRQSRGGYEFVVVTPDGQPVAGPFEGGPELTWTPDSQAVAFAQRRAAAPSRIYERRLADGRTRPLSLPPEGSWGDVAAAFSPNGQRMAIIRYSARGIGDIYLAAYGSQEARRFTKLGKWINGVDWMPDGRHLIAGTAYAKRLGLFRLDTEDQTEPVLIPRTEGEAIFPRATVLPSGDWRIGYGIGRPDENLSVLDSATGERWMAALSSRSEESPAIGERGAIVFNSNRRGRHELWVCPVRDCPSPQRITVNTEAFMDSMPRWSPDGRRIAFAQRVRGSPSILVVDADGTDQRVLSTGFQEGSPAWSADGRAVFFRSDRGGPLQIWRIDASGGGTPEQVTRHGGVECYATADGQSLLYLPAAENASLTRLSLRDGSETVIRGLMPLIQGRWALAGGFIYYFGASTKSSRLRIHRFDLGTGRTADVHAGAEVEWPVGIGANRAGIVVWSSRGPLQSDLIAVDFRPGNRFKWGGWW